jgi:hypothetical protein
MREIDGLPVYKITIDGEDLGIEMIAFTKKPAIKTKGMAFTSEKKVFFSDAEKMRIAAPAMIPMDIYRYDDQTEEEYYVQFTEENIEKIYSKFMRTLSNKDVFNLEHDADKKVPAYVLETLLVDSDAKIKMIKDEYNVDVPKGSVFVVSQITDRNYYNQLVEDEQVGYSIEGMLGLKLSELKSQNKMENPKFELNGKFYELKDGVPVEVAMATEEEVITEEVVEAAEEEKEEEVEMAEPKEEEKEEELAEEEVKEEEVAAEVDVEVDADAVMAIVAPALDALRAEILEALAEKQVEEEVEEEEVEMQETKLSITEKFGAIMREYKNKNY